VARIGDRLPCRDERQDHGRSRLATAEFLLERPPMRLVLPSQRQWYLSRWGGKPSYELALALIMWLSRMASTASIEVKSKISRRAGTSGLGRSAGGVIARKRAASSTAV